MEVIVYSVPSWIIGADNKPSKQVFDLCLQQADKNSIVGMTVEQPDLFTINIQTTGAFDLNSFGNLIEFKGLYYDVSNMSIVTDDETVIITGKIDVYLSFMVNLFDETAPLNPTENLVFFKQKHLNRYSYNGSQQSILYEKQKYLTNIPKTLNVKQKVKNLVYADFSTVGGVDSNNNPLNKGMYLDASWSENAYGKMNDGMGAHNQAYDYLLVKESPQEQSQSGGWGYNLYYGFWQYNGGAEFSNNYLNPVGGGKSERQVNWWEILLSISSEYYIDVIRLPAPIQAGFKNEALMGINLFASSLPTSYLDDYSPGLFNELKQDDQFQENSVLIWKNWGANLYYFCIANFEQWDIQNQKELAVTFQAVNNEPALLNFVECRAHMGGEDCQIDLTAFNYPNEMDLNQFSYLFSFCISLNHPFTQVTNVPYDDFLSFNGDYNLQTPPSWMYPWNYTKTNDAIYCLNLKYSLPTASSNWQNFLANNLNSYHTSLNVSHYMVQEAQARLVQSGINSTEAIMKAANPLAELGGFFTGSNPILNAASAVEGTKEASEQLKSQQAQYQYLASGKEQDMSRVANERNATNGNAFALYNTTLTWIFEYPVAQDMNALINYFMMNGYELNRWDGFSTWNNRVLWNYVSIAFFSDVLLPQLINTYKSKVDDIANKGFRVIKQAFFPNGTITALSTFGTYLINNYNTNGYANYEVNNNNDELDYLTQQGY